MLLATKFPGTGKASPRTGANNLESDWLFQGVVRELKRRGLPAFVGSPAMLRSIAPNFELSSQEVRTYFEQKLSGDPKPPTRTELLALGAILGRSLAVHIEPRMPVTLRTMLVNVGNSVEALENSFPGYLAAGMLDKLVRR